MACFTHSFTTQPFTPGAATLNRPLSRSSITDLISSAYLFSFSNSRLFHTSRINSFIVQFCSENSEDRSEERRVGRGWRWRLYASDVKKNEYSVETGEMITDFH